MSWDAELVDVATGETLAEFNYTHNTNVMANLVLYPDTDVSRGVGEEVFFPQNPPWWQHLDGCGGPSGAQLLDRLIAALKADPAWFRQLNPPNGWGSYDSFLGKLEEMRLAIPASGAVRWTVTG
ncbi:hypothetical protein H7J07_05970 [Mycobacterium koreense]|uniref:Uncharacterized protein n=1 Tax=Mycolicibacillus koreensis TaxID=1069220 RepID=A0A7I7SDH3_9MYCO|nr:hypothetical protein [Mycolicibacillus koreensis]MCV7247773.1 hypothetical protein [Mycolicibacillus koreensis]OSC34708.1 hypothetical protein B8W67_05520 [Mycolicibacillus koreensis]BBY54156.1 hypothetical protein MKOR_14070 [Mycolicibacillus koreensis]